MSQHNPILSHPHIQWLANTPKNLDFNDCYYNTENGIEESQYVFIENNHVLAKWTQFEAHRHTGFSILETGFGSGLNFLLTAEHWLRFQKQSKPKHLSKLCYTAIEGFPIKHDDLKIIIDSWTRDFQLSDELLNVYPLPIEGIYSHQFANIEFRLIQMTLDQALWQFEPKGKAMFDCLYLDGFAPLKNKDMWKESNLRKLGSLCKQGASFSTFTASSSVKTSLSHIGFNIKKIKGFGKKREMLTGIMQRTNGHNYKSKTPWFDHLKHPDESLEKIVIIGAGVAGCATAHALAQHNIRSLVIDCLIQPGGTISDFDKSIYSPLITADFNKSSQFYWAGFSRLEKYLKRNPAVAHDNCGVFYIANSLQQQGTLLSALVMLQKAGLNATWVAPRETQSITGLNLSSPGMYLAQGGWLNAKSYCKNLLDQPLIETSFNTEIVRIQRYASNWILHTQNHAITAKQVVLCNGHSTQLISGFNLARFYKIKGQSTYLQNKDELNHLKLILNNGHYLIPDQSNQMGPMLGATYEHDDINNITAKIDSDIQNLNAFKDINTALTKSIKSNINHLKKQGMSHSPVGFRLSSVDRLPIIGPIPDMDFYKKNYPRFIKSGRLKDCPDSEYLDGLYINCAHSSRGLCSSLISGEVITAMLTGQQIPLSTRLYQAIHPARFFVRDCLKISNL